MPIVGNSKRICTSISNFGDLVRDQWLLVDKTLMIKDFLGGEPISIVTRPRRFGKTLNLSMLQHFFAAEVKGKSTQGLFDRFAIAKEEDGRFLAEHQGKYAVIFVSFKDIKETSYQAAVNQINVLIQELYRTHKHLLKSDKVDEDDKREFQKYLNGSASNEDLHKALKFLSEFLYRAHGNKEVIILIDEYDTPLTAAYEHRDRAPKFLDDFSLFMRNMFSEALKDNSYVFKALITGILRISKENMLSGLNNPKTYTTLERQYEQYFGFTEAEVGEVMIARNTSQALDKIKGYYNGYRIGDAVIYNPWSVMNFFQEEKLAPYWVLTSNDKLIKEVLINSTEDTKKQLGELMQRGTIEGEIHTNLRYEDLMTQKYTLWTLLLFCGYLTSDSAKQSESGTSQICQLRVPNNEVMRQYNQVFKEWLREKMGGKYDHFLKSLADGKVEAFTKSLTGYLFSCTSSHDFQAESDYHCFVLGLLASITETHFLYSNKEYAAGRPDCLLIPKDQTKKEGIILEFKHFHFKKDDDRRDVIFLKDASHRSAQEGLEQINIRGYDHAFNQHNHITEVLKIGIAFSNRIVSSAYTRTAIEHDLELLSGSQEIKFFDATEKEHPKTDLMKKSRLRQRVVQESDDEDDVEESFAAGGPKKTTTASSSAAVQEEGDTEKKSKANSKKRPLDASYTSTEQKPENEEPPAKRQKQDDYKQKTKPDSLSSSTYSMFGSATTAKSSVTATTTTSTHAHSSSNDDVEMSDNDDNNRLEHKSSPS